MDNKNATLHREQEVIDALVTSLVNRSDVTVFSRLGSHKERPYLSIGMVGFAMPHDLKPVVKGHERAYLERAVALGRLRAVYPNGVGVARYYLLD